MCVHWLGKKVWPQSCSWLFLPGLPPPPFPSSHWNSGTVREAKWRLFPIMEDGGHREAMCPEPLDSAQHQTSVTAQGCHFSIPVSNARCVLPSQNIKALGAPCPQHQTSTSFPLGTEAVMLCPCISGLRKSSLSLSRAGTSPWAWWLNNCKGHVSPSLHYPRRHMKKYVSSFVHGTVASCCPAHIYPVWAQAGIPTPWNKLSRLITITFPHLQLNQELVYTIKVKSFSRVRLFATPWTVAH